jgi:hypothetical protein
MIDRENRDKCAAVIEAFLAGRTDIDDLQDGFPRTARKSLDRVVRETPDHVYGLYDDYRHRVIYLWPADIRATLRRIGIFLRSDQEYAWPPCSAWWPGCLIPLAGVACAIPTGHWWLLVPALGLWWLAQCLRGATWRKVARRAGDLETWPFTSAARLEEALAQQGLTPEAIADPPPVLSGIDRPDRDRALGLLTWALSREGGLEQFVAAKEWLPIPPPDGDADRAPRAIYERLRAEAQRKRGWWFGTWRKDAELSIALDRCLVFLRSDRPYDWLGDMMTDWATFPFHSPAEYEEERSRQANGEQEAEPSPN